MERCYGEAYSAAPGTSSATPFFAGGAFFVSNGEFRIVDERGECARAWMVVS